MLFQQSLALMAMSKSMTWAHPPSSRSFSVAANLHGSQVAKEPMGVVPFEDSALERRQVPVPPPIGGPVADYCRIIDTAIRVISVVPENYRGEALATTTGSLGVGFSTFFTCRAMNGNNCGDIAAALGTSIATISLGVSIALNKPTQGTENVESKRSEAEIVEAYSDRLRSLGHRFESLEITVDSAPRDLSGNESAKGGPAGANLKIRGLQSDEHPHRIDHSINLDSGKAISRITPHAALGDRIKRADGDAFKVSYDFYQVHDAVVPDEEGIKALSASVAADWQTRADEDEAMGEYFADLNFGDSYKVAFRVTPETGDNWSEEPEDATACGTN